MLQPPRNPYLILKRGILPALPQFLYSYPRAVHLAFVHGRKRAATQQAVVGEAIGAADKVFEGIDGGRWTHRLSRGVDNGAGGSGSLRAVS